MEWQQVVQIDPYLAGSIAARGWEWWDETTAEQEADSVGLVDDCRANFLRGWHDELAEREQERKEQFIGEYDEMAVGYEKGDPAAR